MKTVKDFKELSRTRGKARKHAFLIDEKIIMTEYHADIEYCVLFIKDGCYISINCDEDSYGNLSNCIIVPLNINTKAEWIIKWTKDLTGIEDKDIKLLKSYCKE